MCCFASYTPVFVRNWLKRVKRTDNPGITLYWFFKLPLELRQSIYAFAVDMEPLPPLIIRHHDYARFEETMIRNDRSHALLRALWDTSKRIRTEMEVVVKSRADQVRQLAADCESYSKRASEAHQAEVDDPLALATISAMFESARIMV